VNWVSTPNGLLNRISRDMCLAYAQQE
jgi:hypothetical protein